MIATGLALCLAFAPQDRDAVEPERRIGEGECALEICRVFLEKAAKERGDALPGESEAGASLDFCETPPSGIDLPDTAFERSPRPVGVLEKEQRLREFQAQF